MTVSEEEDDCEARLLKSLRLLTLTFRERCAMLGLSEGGSAGNAAVISSQRSS